MLRHVFLIATLLGGGIGAAVAAGNLQVVLPVGWRLTSPASFVATTGTMPQGMALSPDGTTLAIVESGDLPSALRLLDAKTLQTKKVIALKGAFGKPVWVDAGHVFVAGAGTDAILNIDVAASNVQALPVGTRTWPAAFSIDSSSAASHRAPVAISDDYDDAAKGSVTFGTVPAWTGGFSTAWAATHFSTIRVGSHPAAALVIGKYIYVALRGQSLVAVLDPTAQRIVKRITVGSHPCDLASSRDGSTLYVAVCDNDSVAVIDTRSNAIVANIPVGFSTPRVHGFGANPNALLVRGNDLFVSLGGENAVALIRNRHVIEYIPAGWYPTGLAIGRDGTLYVSNGKGERSPANPQFAPGHHSTGYVADITVGSVRAIPRAYYENSRLESARALANAMPLWAAPPPSQTIVRPHGPITHVIYIIKENRSYDQVLGDIAGANGDASLVMFGRAITPNQHALAQRFGIFDNAYADAQVSADGHNWTDAATANDYVERFWPSNYGGRRDVFDFQNGVGANVPHSGFLWDAAKRAGLTYRDYGEDMSINGGPPLAVTDHPALINHFDPAFVGWNLKYSDLDRFKEWKREFTAMAARHRLPQLEIVYFPNDHTAGSQQNMPTPQAYVAMNDWVVGQLIDSISHSEFWKSTAIFVLEDDAQNGPDHVSAQRSTFYIASPYARGGVNHAHYSTVSVVRTIELLLGLPALSVKDATAQPMYSAFATTAVNARPFRAIKPAIDMDAMNARAAYGSAISAHLDFSKPDAVDPRVLNDILEHAVRNP